MAETTDSTLPKAYNPTEAESRWYQEWQDAGLFTPDAKATTEGGKTPYVVMMPPPNVTGHLHNGHALFVTLQDILVRTHRMRGENALWLPGVDHAGIATQSVVERQLKKLEGKTRHDVGREKFLEHVWAWKEKNGGRIVEQLKTLGASADWSRMHFTMDEQCSKAVRAAFVKMWNDDLIYRGERLVNWDPATHTALSDEEVEHEEKKGELWRFAYKVKGEDGQATDQEIVVATTRPETMLGDTAVAVHPDDERYQDLIGKELVHPFFADRRVVVVADDYVDQEFGTGAVKITPAHDPNDFDIGQRHSLPMLNIMTFDAKINQEGGPEFAGLDRYDARKKVKEAIEALGLARGTEEHVHQVSVSQRSGAAIEPMLSRQYFVNAKPLAEQALAAVQNGETRIIPESWTKTYNHFMENIRDWCISRQLWWGHRIPVFYDLDKLEAAIREDAAARKAAGASSTEALDALEAGKSKAELLKIALSTLDDKVVRGFSVASADDLAAAEPERYAQEEDVLDTWFSAGLWPFATLGWPEKTDDLAAFYPGAVLETGFDILFFWVARMMMMGIYFMGEAPFKDVYLHAMVRDAQGKKMSKTLGNAVDPLDVTGGITLEDLLAKTKTHPVPEKLLPKVLKGLKKDYADGIPASGADGLRFTLAALSGAGRDVKLAIPRVQGYRAFLNKIWNASRFALMRVGDGPIKPLADVKGDLSVADRWVLARLDAATAAVNTAIDTYRFDVAADTMYQFFWTEFCDWYIELAKTSLADEGSAGFEATRTVLVHVLDTALRLLHPLCPFQTEEIWQRLPGRDTRWADVSHCAIAPYPTADGAADADAVAAISTVQDLITMVRNARQESDLPAQKAVPVVVLCDDADTRALIESFRGEIERLARLDGMTLSATADYTVPKAAAVNASATLQVVIPLEGLIDLDAERTRLQKALAKLQKEMGGLKGRLSSPKFVDKAPAAVVDKARADLAALEEKAARINTSLERIS